MKSSWLLGDLIHHDLEEAVVRLKDKQASADAHVSCWEYWDVYHLAQWRMVAAILCIL